MKRKTVLAMMFLVLAVLAANSLGLAISRSARNLGPFGGFGMQVPGPIAPPVVKPEAKTTLGEGGNASGQVAHEMTAADLEPFIGGILPLQLEQDDIAGATVSVVKDGKLLFAKGYGYADVKNKKPVSAEDTLFRCGSISKLFTWTSVMQLQEQGKLDLDRDINDYLDFKIPYTFQKPITLRNLMTHTPGFEEVIKDLIGYSSSPQTNLEGYLKTHLPAEIFPPGTVPAYSNYGAALAGYIVQRVSGVPLNEYIKHNIFEPLGMTHSSFEQPLPPQLAPSMSDGYKLGSGDAKQFETIMAWPAGSLSSSATDIARFMIAHLQNGKYGDATILKPQTAELMHSRQFGLVPELNGMDCGFYEESRNGDRIIGHGGDTIWFHSDLHLILDSGLGFFVSYNSQGRAEASPREELWYAILDRYFPYTPPDEPTVGSAKEDASKVTGAYLPSRRGDKNFTKALSLLSQIKVSANDDGTLETPEALNFNGQPKKWQEIGPLIYREINGQDEIVFKPLPGGGVQAALSWAPIEALQKTEWYTDGRLLVPALEGSLILLLMTVVLWPVSWFVRRHYGRKLELSTGARRFRIIVYLVCILDLLCLGGFLIFMLYANEHLEALSDKSALLLHSLQVIGVLGAAGTLAAVLNAAGSWFSSERGIWYKFYATVLSLACLVIVWFELLSHVFSFTLRY
jgi:CubicO group peptidase (beta-lactamase class C family)